MSSVYDLHAVNKGKTEANIKEEYMTGFPKLNGQYFQQKTRNVRRR